MPATGVDGLHVALTEPLALIVLDINLPDISGWQMLEKLRRTKDLPVLILSARGSVDERIRGLEAGGRRCLRPTLKNSSACPAW